MPHERAEHVNVVNPVEMVRKAGIPEIYKGTCGVCHVAGRIALFYFQYT
jgi:hypothetical protein